MSDYCLTTDAARLCLERARLCWESVGEYFLFAKINRSTNLWAPADIGEDTVCLELLEQQSVSISHSQFINTHVSRKLHKSSFLLQPKVYETKYIIIT